MKDQPWASRSQVVSNYKHLWASPKYGAQKIKFWPLFSRLPHSTPSKVYQHVVSQYSTTEINTWTAQPVTCIKNWHWDTVIYSLTETETETNIISLSETERETEMICKTETKYERKSEHMKRNSNWNENDFKTKMVTWNVKQAFSVPRFSDSIRL